MSILELLGNGMFSQGLLAIIIIFHNVFINISVWGAKYRKLIVPEMGCGMTHLETTKHLKQRICLFPRFIWSAWKGGKC